MASVVLVSVAVGVLGIGPAKTAPPRALQVSVASAHRTAIAGSTCELSATRKAVIATGRVTKKGFRTPFTLSLSVYDAQGAMLDLRGLVQSTTVAANSHRWHVQADILGGFDPTRCLIDVAIPRDLRSFTANSTSMYPTIKFGAHTIVDESAYAASTPRPGDIVVFRRPPAEDCGGPPVPDLVKRVVGLPGETVQGENGILYIDGSKLPQPWLPKKTSNSNPYTSTFGPIKVPRGDYFMMGDNRTDSCDSRDYGPVTGTYIVGKVVQVIPGSSTTATTTTLRTTSTTTVPMPTTTLPSAVPLVSVCGTPPANEPSALYWCTSLCSSYMTGIEWSNWGPTSATGTGTYVTKTTTPRTGQTIVSCATATPVQHPGTPAVLSDPQYVTICPPGGGKERVLLFTKASWWTFPIPDLTQCNG
jgi:signal peptidase I